MISNLDIRYGGSSSVNLGNVRSVKIAGQGSKPQELKMFLKRSVRYRARVFTARRYANAVYSVIVCPSVYLSVCLSECEAPYSVEQPEHCAVKRY